VVPATEDLSTLPFCGLRVVELTAFWAGPIVGNILGMLGADVIHVESAARPDGMRFNTVKPLTSEAWWEWSPLFQGANTDKRGLTLDLSTEEGRAVFGRLAETADLIVENYSPRVLAEWGLDYQSLARSNPGLILLRMPAFGLEGPWRDRVGYAQTMEQISGLSWISGAPGRPPVTLYGPADPIGGCHGLIGALLALEHRRRTGEGMLVESPQIGGALNIAAEQVIEYSAYGALLNRTGNRTPGAAPSGTYLCADVAEDGTRDVWIVISIESDEQWTSLCGALDAPSWTHDDTLATAAGRAAVADQLDATIGQWCSERFADEAVTALVAAGVPAARVIGAHEAAGLQQLWARGFFERLVHPTTGESIHTGFPATFSSRRSPWHRRPAPRLGEHNRELLIELGFSDEEIARMHDDLTIGTEVGGGGKAW
jgi:crotonobetainyl-CoA:carnitine CoA-transferase CaiB-like acyl-CoA transferase